MNCRAWRGEVRQFAARWQKDSAKHQRGHRAHFGYRKNVLDDATKFDADVINGCEERDNCSSQGFDADIFEWRDIAGERQVNGPGSDRRGEFWEANEFARVFGKNISDGCD